MSDHSASPECQRWVSLLRAVCRGQAALATQVLERSGTRDYSALNLDERRDIGTLIALAEHAAVLCDRLIASLSDSDDE